MKLAGRVDVLLVTASLVLVTEAWSRFPGFPHLLPHLHPHPHPHPYSFGIHRLLRPRIFFPKKFVPDIVSPGFRGIPINRFGAGFKHGGPAIAHVNHLGGVRSSVHNIYHRGSSGYGDVRMPGAGGRPEYVVGGGAASGGPGKYVDIGGGGGPEYVAAGGPAVGGPGGYVGTGGAGAGAGAGTGGKHIPRIITTGDVPRRGDMHVHVNLGENFDRPVARAGVNNPSLVSSIASGNTQTHLGSNPSSLPQVDPYQPGVGTAVAPLAAFPRDQQPGSPVGQQNSLYTIQDAMPTARQLIANNALAPETAVGTQLSMQPVADPLQVGANSQQQTFTNAAPPASLGIDAINSQGSVSSTAQQSPVGNNVVDTQLANGNTAPVSANSPFNAQGSIGSADQRSRLINEALGTPGGSLLNNNAFTNQQQTGNNVQTHPQNVGVLDQQGLGGNNNMDMTQSEAFWNTNNPGLESQPSLNFATNAGNFQGVQPTTFLNAQDPGLSSQNSLPFAPNAGGLQNNFLNSNNMAIDILPIDQSGVLQSTSRDAFGSRGTLNFGGAANQGSAEALNLGGGASQASPGAGNIPGAYDQRGSSSEMRF